MPEPPTRLISRSNQDNEFIFVARLLKGMESARHEAPKAVKIEVEVVKISKREQKIFDRKMFKK